VKPFKGDVSQQHQREERIERDNKEGKKKCNARNGKERAKRCKKEEPEMMNPSYMTDGERRRGRCCTVCQEKKRLNVFS